MAIAALGLEMAAHTHGPVWISAIAGVVVFGAVALAVVGVRGITRPLAELAAMTKRIACGEAHGAILHRDRQDEIGAVARSMALFQDAMRRNTELTQTVFGETETRTRRQS